MSGDVSGAKLAGRRSGGLPYPFLKIEKISLIIWKNASCSNSKCYFKSI